MALANQGSYFFGAFQLNLDLRVLARRGERVPLGSKAYEVLAYLVSHAGEAVPKAVLLKAVWIDSFVEESTLAQHISILRKALGDNADYIVTIQGVGYQFSGAVKHRATQAETAGTASHHVIYEASERTRMVIDEPVLPPLAARPRRAWPYVAAVVALILVTVAAVRFRPHPVPPDQFVGAVVADFTNTTGDATFDRSLKRAMEIELGQSPLVGVSSDQDAVSTLGLMGLKPDTPLSPAIAREVCERDNRQVVLTGGIASVGPQYL